MKKIRNDLVEVPTGRGPETKLTDDNGNPQKGVLLWVPTREKSLFRKEFFQMAQASLRMINQHRKTLGLEGMAVFNELLFQLDFENFIRVSQVEIAKELEMHPNNVSRAIRKLKELGFVTAGPRVGNTTTLRLHPEIAWKGKPKNHREALSQVPPLRVIQGGLKDGDDIGLPDL